MIETLNQRLKIILAEYQESIILENPKVQVELILVGLPLN